MESVVTDDVIIPIDSNTEPDVKPLSDEDIELRQIDADDSSFDLELRIMKLLSVAQSGETAPIEACNYLHKPLQVNGAWKTYQQPPINNYTKGCKWAPDGSCVLTNSEDHKLKIFNFPMEILKVHYGEAMDWTEIQEMMPALTISESELVYSYCWYPLMSSAEPITCCLLSTCKNQPIHLWDAFTGSLRSSYRAYDHLDEIVAAHSVAFDPYGVHIYSGYNKAIRIFDLSVPGREFRKIETKFKGEGQTGIISCLAVNPANHRIIAAGSYCKSVGLYLEPKGERLCILAGQSGGVTNMEFSPDGSKLYTGGRKDPEILCWDIRNPGKILFTLRRIVSTNQRIYFDVTRDGKYVVSGNHNGVVSIWDTNASPKEIPGFQEPVLEPVNFFQAHSDCVNGISCHPSMAVLATSSGQRKISNPLVFDSDSSDSEIEDTKEDISLRLWWMGGSKEFDTKPS